MQRVNRITAGSVLCGILIGLMCCGVAKTAEDSVNGYAVSRNISIAGESAETESGSAVSKSTSPAGESTEAENDWDVEKSRYANHNNIYKEDVDWAEHTLIQWDLDGTEIQRYQIKHLDWVAWVTDEWVYYVTQSSKYALWRAPIEKTASGDRLELDRAERLFREEELYKYDVYVADAGIFYIAGEYSEGYELRWYDFSNKDSVLLKKSEEWQEFLFWNKRLPMDEKPIMLGDSLLVQCDSELYALDTVDVSLKEIYKGLKKDLSPDSIVECEDSVYFVPDPKGMQVYRYDGEKVECVLTKDVMMKKISDINDLTQGEVMIEKIFPYKDRMYFYVPVRDAGYNNPPIQSQLLSAPIDKLLDLEEDYRFSYYMDNYRERYPLQGGVIEEIELKLKDPTFSSLIVGVDGGWDGKLMLQALYFVPWSGVGWYYYDYAIYNLDTGKIEETELAKAVQNRDKKAIRKAALQEELYGF